MEGKPKPASFVWDSLWSKSTIARARLNVVDTLVFEQGQLSKWIFTAKDGRVVKKSDANLNMSTVKQHFMRLAVDEARSSDVIAVVDADSSSTPSTMVTKDCWEQFTTDLAGALELSGAQNWPPSNINDADQEDLLSKRKNHFKDHMESHFNSKKQQHKQQPKRSDGFDARITVGSSAMSFCSIQTVRSHRQGVYRSTFELQKDSKNTKLVTHKLTSTKLLKDKEGMGSTNDGGKWFLNRAAALNHQVDDCTKQLVAVIEANKRVKVCTLQVCYSQDEQRRFWLCDVLKISTRKLSAISDACTTFSADAQAKDAQYEQVMGLIEGRSAAPTDSFRAPLSMDPTAKVAAGAGSVQHSGKPCACAGDFCEYNAKEEERQLLERIDPRSHMWGTDQARDEETRFLQQQIELQKRLQQEEEAKTSAQLGVRTHKVSLRSVQQARRDAIEVADDTLQRWLLKQDARKKLKEAGGSSDAAKSLSIVEPAMGAQMRVGEVMLIRWAHTGDMQAVQLSLYCGLQMVLELTSEERNIGEYAWAVQDPHPLLTKSSAAAAANGGAGVLWRVKICEFGGGSASSAVSDYSEPFEIDAAVSPPRAGVTPMTRTSASATAVGTGVTAISLVGKQPPGGGRVVGFAPSYRGMEEEIEPMQPHNPLRPHKMVMVCQRCHDCYEHLDERREKMQQQAYKQQARREAEEEQWQMEFADSQAHTSSEPLNRIHAMRQGDNPLVDGMPRSVLSPRATLRPVSDFQQGPPGESGREVSRRLLELSELTGTGSSATYEDYEDMARQAQQREEDGEGLQPHEARPQSLGALREIKLNPLRSNGGKEYNVDTDRSGQSRRSSGTGRSRRQLPDRTVAAIERLSKPSVTRAHQLEEDEEGAENWKLGRTLEGGANDKLRQLYRGGGGMSVRKKGETSTAKASAVKGGKKERWWNQKGQKGGQGEEGGKKSGKKKGNTGAPQLQSAMRAEERRTGKKPTRWAPLDEVAETKKELRRRKMAKQEVDEKAQAERKWQRAQDFMLDGAEDGEDEEDEDDEPPTYEEFQQHQQYDAAGVTVNTERGQKLLEEVQTMMKNTQQQAKVGDAFAMIDAEWANVGQLAGQSRGQAGDSEDDVLEEDQQEHGAGTSAYAAPAPAVDEESSEEEEEEAMDWVSRMKQRVNAMTSEVATKGGGGGGINTEPVASAHARDGAGNDLAAAARAMHAAEEADPRFHSEVTERQSALELDRERQRQRLIAAEDAAAANVQPSWKQLMEQRQAEVEKHIQELPVLRQISCPAGDIEGKTGTLQHAMGKCSGLPDCAMTDAIAWGYYTFHAAKDALQPQIAKEGGRLMFADDASSKMLEYFNRYADTTGKQPLGAVFEAVDGQLSSLKQEAAKGPANVDQTTIKIYSRLLELLHFTEGQMKLRGLPAVGKRTNHVALFA
jgi:hypothetical protein